jgi:hypothetical protein
VVGEKVLFIISSVTKSNGLKKSVCMNEHSRMLRWYL